MKNTEFMYKRIRNVCGLLGMLLPWIALFSASLVANKPSEWFYSISATYYLTPALAMVLTAASIVLMCYDGYEFIDNLVTTSSGVFGLLVVLFPCNTAFIEGRVGFFQVDVALSNIIHCISAGVFFALLAVNSLFLFTKTEDTQVMTDKKKVRNVIYRVCGIGMLVFGIVQSFIAFLPPWMTMVNEIFMLQFFGVSWLVKGGAVPFLND